MGHKVFFMFCFLLVLGGIGFLTAFSLNALPEGVYIFVYDTLAFRSPQATYPYLTKFEGRWLTKLTPAFVETDVAQCDPTEGTLKVHDGHVTGTLGALNKYISIVADIDEGGNLVGKTIRSQGDLGTISATILASSGTGEWTDAFGCKGTLTMKKADPYEDPIKGTLISYTGGATLTRGDKTELPRPGESLYAGDRIDVPQGGSAYFSIGLLPVNLSGGMSYTVADK